MHLITQTIFNKHAKDVLETENPKIRQVGNIASCVYRFDAFSGLHKRTREWLAEEIGPTHVLTDPSLQILIDIQYAAWAPLPDREFYLRRVAIDYNLEWQL